MRMCRQVKTRPMHEAFDKSAASHREADKYPVLSDGWNTNIAAANYWGAEGQRLYRKFYGTNN